MARDLLRETDGPDVHKSATFPPAITFLSYFHTAIVSLPHLYYNTLMARKKVVALSPPAPPLPSPLERLLSSLEIATAGEVRRKWDDLGLLSAQKAFGWVESVGRMPSGMDFDQFVSLYQVIMES